MAARWADYSIGSEPSPAPPQTHSELEQWGHTQVVSGSVNVSINVHLHKRCKAKGRTVSMLRLRCTYEAVHTYKPPGHNEHTQTADKANTVHMCTFFFSI